MRYFILLLIATLSACAHKEICEIKYRDCCLVETKTELKLKGEHCWPAGMFIFQAGDIQRLIDAGKKQQESIVKSKGVIPE